MADQNKDGNSPISNGIQPGPGERLRDDVLQTPGVSGMGTSSLGTASSAAGSSGGIDAGMTGSSSLGGGGSGSGSASGSAGGSASGKGASGMGGMGMDAGSMRESGSRMASGAKQYAGDIANRAKEKSRTMFEQQKETAVGQVDNVASAIRSTASQLQGQGQGQVAHYVEMVADQLESLSGRLREKDLDTIVQDAQNLARRAPGTFFVGTVVAGFLLARFMKSTSEQRDAGMGMAQGDWQSASAGEAAPYANTPGGSASVGADGTPTASLDSSSLSAGGTPLNGSRSGGNSL